MSDTMRSRISAAAVAVAPVIVMLGFLYHPYIADLTDEAAVAAALTADTTRWGFSHLIVGVGSGFVMLAFIAIRGWLREADKDRWSGVALPFVVLGSTLFALLPAMEIGVMAGVEAGADAAAAQSELDSWFLPVLLSGAVLFALGAVGFAAALLRSGLTSPGLAWTVAAALVVMAAARFVPLGAVQFYVGGVAGLVALWPLAYLMWKQTQAPRESARPLPV